MVGVRGDRTPTGRAPSAPSYIFSEGFLNGRRNIGPAASPAGWPPAPQNTTDLHPETLCITF